MKRARRLTLRHGVKQPRPVRFGQLAQDVRFGRAQQGFKGLEVEALVGARREALRGRRLDLLQEVVGQAHVAQVVTQA